MHKQEGCLSLSYTPHNPRYQQPTSKGDESPGSRSSGQHSRETKPQLSTGLPDTREEQRAGLSAGRGFTKVSKTQPKEVSKTLPSKTVAASGLMGFPEAQGCDRRISKWIRAKIKVNILIQSQVRRPRRCCLAKSPKDEALTFKEQVLPFFKRQKPKTCPKIRSAATLV